MSEANPDDHTYEALCEALDDEYKARAAYRAVITTFGQVRPFSNIAHSEQRHIEALLAQFRRLRLKPPADRWNGNIAAPPSLHEACRIGVQAEIDNMVLYDHLLAMTTDDKVLRVFMTLRTASAKRHLPAFRRCVDRAKGGIAGV